MDKNIRTRKTNMEVLRVVSMLFIVIGHYLYWGVFGNPILGYNAFPPDSWLDWSTMEAARLLTTISVDLYVMITGYFLIDRTTFRWKGIKKVWIETLFYSIVITILVLSISGEGPRMKPILESALPVTLGKYWFVQKYIGLLLLAPFLSRLAMILSKKEYRMLLAIMLILFIQIPIREPFNSGTVCSLSWFVFLYMLAGYYRLYGAPKVLENHSLIIAVVLLGSLFTCALGLNVLEHGPNVNNYILYSTGTDSFLFFLSVPIFICFSKHSCKGRFCLWLSRLAPYTFGVYLIHENRALTSWLWGEVMPQTVFWPKLQIIHCIAFSIVLFGVCVIIDAARQILWPSKLR